MTSGRGRGGGGEERLHPHPSHHALAQEDAEAQGRVDRARQDLVAQVFVAVDKNLGIERLTLSAPQEFFFLRAKARSIVRGWTLVSKRLHTSSTKSSMPSDGSSLRAC